MKKPERTDPKYWDGREFKMRLYMSDLKLWKKHLDKQRKEFE